MAKNHLSNVFWGPRSHPEFMAGIQQAINQLAPSGIYAADNLFTFGRNLGFLDDLKFLTSLEQNVTNDIEYAIVWRTHVVVWSAMQALRREGDFVECGCYKGTTAKIVCDYLGFANINKQYYLYDLFEHDESMEHHAMPDHGPGLYEQTIARLNGPTAELAALECLFERMVPGAILILDDYGWGGYYAAQKMAEDPFFEARGYQVLELPTGQGMVLR